MSAISNLKSQISNPPAALRAPDGSRFALDSLRAPWHTIPDGVRCGGTSPQRPKRPIGRYAAGDRSPGSLPAAPGDLLSGALLVLYVFHIPLDPVCVALGTDVPWLGFLLGIPERPEAVEPFDL